ncbi:hypothetical protein EB796_008224 [Bugula neritina]|uniref:Uncharacterized protein n=1 Tax=Bugula neritina TaxID=10212 RepID=A0A7J7K777_BUGNE|nr:hypothetical protein EB796_008224 [Bugula neritina]
MFDHRSVCQTASMLSHALSIRVLKALQHQLKEYGPTLQTHKLKGKVVYDKRRTAQNAFQLEVTTDVVQFLKNYAEKYGLPQPAALRARPTAFTNLSALHYNKARSSL